MIQYIPILNQGQSLERLVQREIPEVDRQGDVLAALAKDPSIKAPIAIGNWSNAVESDPKPSFSSGFALTPLYMITTKGEA